MFKRLVAILVAALSLLVSSSVFSQEFQPVFGSSYSQLSSIETIWGIAPAINLLKDNLDLDVDLAVEKLSKLRDEPVYARKAFYSSSSTTGAAYAVQFVASRYFKVESEVIGHGPLRMTDRIYSAMVPVIETVTVVRPDGSMAEVPRVVIVSETRTSMDMSPSAGYYNDLATCEERRVSAESKVGSDPHKKVFWSTCHELDGSFYMKVHFVFVPGE
ncbi:MAG: hypothetical protein NTV34_22105 [Proteobacteria bacterium]|nr:hypothetical protein [Pseudomonadota bacterium]